MVTGPYRERIAHSKPGCEVRRGVARHLLAPLRQVPGRGPPLQQDLYRADHLHGPLRQGLIGPSLAGECDVMI